MFAKPGCPLRCSFTTSLPPYPAEHSYRSAEYGFDSPREVRYDTLSFQGFASPDTTLLGADQAKSRLIIFPGNSMNPKRRTALISRLANGIGYVATDFERFGGLFIQALLELPLDHRGLNLLGYPVAGVVDTTNGDGKVVVEYSDRKDYFSGDMDKARGDLAHALAGAPKSEKVFLLSGQPSRPQIAQEFERQVLAMPEMDGRTLLLWGSVEIATQLVDHLIISDAAVRKLSPYLPDLERIRDEEAASRLVPEMPDTWLPRADIDAEMTNHFKQNPVLAIAGVGGLGKTAVAQAYAHLHQNEYHLRIWLDGDEIRRVEDLQAVQLLRVGESRNVVGLMDSGPGVGPLSRFGGRNSEWAEAHLLFPGRMTTGATGHKQAGDSAAAGAVDAAAAARCLVHRRVWTALPVSRRYIATRNCAAVRPAAFSL
jgi:hypothetical protein